MPTATSSIVRIAKPKPLSLDRKTFKRLFKPVDEDYFETTPIIEWFCSGAGVSKRLGDYKKSSKTQKEIDRWNGALEGLIIAPNGSMILLESGEIQEGIHGKTSGRIHRVLMPHFLEWLQKGTDHALVAWWTLYHTAPKPEPPPLQLRLELRESSKEVRRSLTDLYKAWWDAHPGESKAPNFGTYCWQRENQLMQALFGQSITALKADRSLTKDDTLRDFLPAEWLELLSQTEESIASLLEADIPPKQAIEAAAKSVSRRSGLMLGGGESRVLQEVIIP